MIVGFAGKIQGLFEPSGWFPVGWSGEEKAKHFVSQVFDRICFRLELAIEV